MAHYCITCNPSHRTTSLIRRHVMSWRDARGLGERHGCCGRKLFYCSKLVLLNDDDDDEEETLGEYVQSTKQLKKIRRWVEMPKKKDPIIMTTEMFSPWSWWIILWLISFVTQQTFLVTHLILAHDSTHSSSSFLIYPNIHTMSPRTSLIVIHFYSYDSFSCVASSFFPWLRIMTHSWLIFDSHYSPCWKNILATTS